MDAAFSALAETSADNATALMLVSGIFKGDTVCFVSVKLKEKKI